MTAIPRPGRHRLDGTRNILIGPTSIEISSTPLATQICGYLRSHVGPTATVRDGIQSAASASKIGLDGRAA
jgi:hypothetical protein